MESTINQIDGTIQKLCQFINEGIDSKALHSEIGSITGSLASLIQARAELSKGTQTNLIATSQPQKKRTGARMRTLENAVALIKEEDPESTISVSLLRQGIKEGKIRVAKIGQKTLIDVDSYLDDSFELEEPQESLVTSPIVCPQKRTGNTKIRPVPR